MYLMKRAAARLPVSAPCSGLLSSLEQAWLQPPPQDGTTGVDCSPCVHRRHCPAPSPATLYAPAAWLSPLWACTASCCCCCCCVDREAEEGFFFEAVEEEQEDKEEKEEVDEEDGEEDDEQEEVPGPPRSLSQPDQVLLASLALVWKAPSLAVRYLSNSVHGRLTSLFDWGQTPLCLLFQRLSV